MFLFGFCMFSLRPGSTVNCILGFSPPHNPDQNPSQKSGQKPGQKSDQNIIRQIERKLLGKHVENCKKILPDAPPPNWQLQINQSD